MRGQYRQSSGSAVIQGRRGNPRRRPVHSGRHDRHHPGSDRLHNRLVPGPLVRDLLRRRPGGGLLVLIREARRRGQNAELVGNGMVIVAIAALIGGRLYHVIDQWAHLPGGPDHGHPADHQGGRRVVCLRRVLRPRRPRRHHHRDDRRLVPHPPLEGRLRHLGRHRRAGPVRHAGDRADRATSSTRSCTARRRRCRGASRSTAPIGSPAYPCDRVPVRDDPLPPALPVRVAVGADRCGRPALAGPAQSVAAPAGRPAADLLRLVRDDALPARVPAERQLDVLRDPDGADRDGRLHRRRPRRAVVPPRRSAGRPRPSAPDRRREPDADDEADDADDDDDDADRGDPTSSRATVAADDEPDTPPADRVARRAPAPTAPTPRRAPAAAGADLARRRWRTRAAAPSRGSPGSAGRPSRGRRSSTGSSGCSPGRPVRAVPLQDRDRRPGAPAGGGYLIVGAAHRGWMDPFVVLHALPTEPRVWFLGSAPSTFTSRWREWLSTGSAGCCRSGAAGSAIEQHVASARAVDRPTAASSPRCRRGPSAGPPAGSGRSGWAGRSSRSGRRRRSSRSRWPGRRSSTSASGWRRGFCPRRRSASCSGDGWDGVLPVEGSREELGLARRLTDALAALLGPVVERAPSRDRRSARSSASPATAAHLAAPPAGPAGSRRLTAGNGQ